MSEDRSAVREIVWREVFPSLILLRTVRLALSFRVMLLAAVALVGMVAGWRLIGGAFSGSSETVLQNMIQSQSVWPWDAGVSPIAPGVSLGSELWSGGPHHQSIFDVWHKLSDPFLAIFRWEAPLVVWAYSLCCGLWALLLWSFIGGSIVRSTAVALAREEQLSLGATVAFGSSKWVSLFMAPLFPMIGATVAAVPAMVIGLLLNMEAGVIVAGLVWCVLLLLGILMAVLLVGLFFGWPLMWATIGVERTDAFDALSRSYAYTFQRPLRYFLYVLGASVLGVLAVSVVQLLADQVVQLTFWGASWGAGVDDVHSVTHPPVDASTALVTGSKLLAFWTNLVLLFAAAYSYSYFWSAITAIYFLLRRQVDAVEMDEINMPEQEQAFDLPPLEADAANVPGVPADATVTPPTSPEG